MSEVKNGIIKQLETYDYTQQLPLENILQNQSYKEYLNDILSKQDDKFKNFNNELIMKIIQIDSIQSEDDQIIINEEHIKQILDNMTKEVTVEKISQDTFKLIFQSPLQAYLTKIGFEDLKFDDLQLKIQIEQVQKTLNIKKNYSPKKWTNDLKLSLSKKKHSDSISNGFQQNQSNKFTCRFDVTIESDKNFQVAKKIIGSGGCNMKRIIENTIKNQRKDSLKLRLRGIGSGYKEGPDNKESQEPLHLCVSAKNMEVYKSACKHVEELLQKIYDDYLSYLRKNYPYKLEDAEYIESLKFSKNENFNNNQINQQNIQKIFFIYYQFQFINQQTLKMSDFKNTPQVQFNQRPIQDNQESRFWKKFSITFQKNFDENVNFVTYNQQRNLYAFGVSNSIIFYNMNKNQIYYDYKKEKEIVRSCTIRQDGNIAAFSNSSGYVKILNLKHRKFLKSFQVFKSPIFGIDISNQNSLLSIGSDMGSLRLHDYAADMELFSLHQLHKDFLRTVKFFDEKYDKIITGSFDRFCKIIDIKSRQEILEIFNTEEIEDLTVINDNQIGIVGGRQLKIWDLRNSEQPLLDLTVSNKTITSIKKIQNKLITSSLDNFIKVLDINKNFQIIHQINYQSPILQFTASQNLNSFSIIQNNQKIKIFKKGKEEKIEQQNIDQDPLERELFKKLYFGVQSRDQSSYKFYNRGIYEKQEDYTFKITKPVKVKRQIYDNELKKFQFTNALQKALNSNNTVIIISLFQELMIRNNVNDALKNLDQNYQSLLLEFILKKIDSVNCQKTIFSVYNNLINNFSYFFKSEKNVNLLNKIVQKIDNEINQCITCQNLVDEIKILQ